jgi:hypothetical protein
MNAIEWGLILGVIAILVGPFLALKAVAKFRSNRSSRPDSRNNRQ